MKFRCYCGRGFSLNQKSAKLILHDQELFCSCQCFLQYLLDLKPQTKSLPFLVRSEIDQPTQQWDRITKQTYRSLYEVYVARFLQSNDILFEYEKYTLPLGTKTYTPDFYLTEYNLFVEVKGAWASGSKKKFYMAQKHIDLILLPSYLQRDFAKKYKDV